MRELLRPTSTKRFIFFMVADIFISLATLYISYLFRFNFHIPIAFYDTFWMTYIIVTSFKILTLLFFKSYFVVWRFFSFLDAKHILFSHLIAYFCFSVIYLMFWEHFSPFPRSVIMIDFFLSLIFIGSLRALRRFLNEVENNKILKPTLLVGVNSKTTTVINSALRGDIAYYPSAIVAIDKNENAINGYIQNIRVYGLEKLEEIIEKKEIKAIIVAGDVDTSFLQNLVDRVANLGVEEIKKVKLLGDKSEKLEDISIEDLLARYPKDLELEKIENFIKGKVILITGAGGSIGSEISRQCDRFGAKSLILVESSEFNLYQIGEEIKGAVLKLVNVTEYASLNEIFELFKPEIVIHAAAYKHVPICEENQAMAVKNNVLGTKNVIDVSILHQVKKLVIISTDKAVRPTNVMGATKRVTELYAQNVVSRDTEIVAVRFGNVLGSSGSVIPKFKKQIEAGESITVTHPEITRYFMLIPEACQLVLQTATIAKGGELFILDMGEPVKIVDLASQMLKLYGKEDEIEIVFSGLRAGEKLYEELLLDESDKKTQYDSIFIAPSTVYDITQLNHDIDILLKSQNKIKALQKIVPEFKREQSNH